MPCGKKKGKGKGGKKKGKEYRVGPADRFYIAYLLDSFERHRKLFAAISVALLLAATPALAQDEGRGIVHDGTIDLRVLLLGKTLAADLGFVSVGIRSKPGDISGIDAEPTSVSLLKAGCSWGLPRSLLALRCE